MLHLLIQRYSNFELQYLTEITVIARLVRYCFSQTVPIFYNTSTFTFHTNRLGISQKEYG